MIVVVADSSPLNYLVLIKLVDILPRLYPRVLVPLQVIEELADPAAPEAVRTWARTPPHWIEVRRAAMTDDPGLNHLDPGEQAAIQLAQLERATLLLIDDADGRVEASRRGIPTTGTLGILRAASLRHHVDLREALTRLLRTNFRVSAALVDELLAEDSRRRERNE